MVPGAESLWLRKTLKLRICWPLWNLKYQYGYHHLTFVPRTESVRAHLLGRVDRFDPEFCCPDAQHGEEGSCGFVVARGHAVKLFEGVDAAGVKMVLVGLAIGLAKPITAGSRFGSYATLANGAVSLPSAILQAPRPEWRSAPTAHLQAGDSEAVIAQASTVRWMWVPFDRKKQRIHEPVPFGTVHIRRRRARSFRARPSRYRGPARASPAP
jgi:hypothetical protein